MGKNVLILSANPRKGGNSDLLCDEFLRGAQEAGNKVEKAGRAGEVKSAPAMMDACKMENPCRYRLFELQSRKENDRRAALKNRKCGPA